MHPPPLKPEIEVACPSLTPNTTGFWHPQWICLMDLNSIDNGIHGADQPKNPWGSEDLPELLEGTSVVGKNQMCLSEDLPDVTSREDLQPGLAIVL